MNKEFSGLVSSKIAQYMRESEAEDKTSSDAFDAPSEASNASRRSKRDEKMPNTEVWTEERKQQAEDELARQERGSLSIGGSTTWTRQARFGTNFINATQIASTRIVTTCTKSSQSC